MFFIFYSRKFGKHSTQSSCLCGISCGQSFKGYVPGVSFRVFKNPLSTEPVTDKQRHKILTYYSSIKITRPELINLTREHVSCVSLSTCCLCRVEQRNRKVGMKEESCQTVISYCVSCHAPGKAWSELGHSFSVRSYNSLEAACEHVSQVLLPVLPHSFKYSSITSDRILTHHHVDDVKGEDVNGEQGEGHGEQIEVSVVPLAHAVAYPRTVVIKSVCVKEKKVTV